MTTSEIKFNAEGDPYFELNGADVSFDEVMRIDSMLLPRRREYGDAHGLLLHLGESYLVKLVNHDEEVEVSKLNP